MVHRIALRARASQHFVYSGRCLLVTNLDGQVTGQGTEGFYAQNTRLLSRDCLLADGKPLKPVAASPVGGHAFLAYAEVMRGSQTQEQGIYVGIARFLGDGMRTRMRLENCWMRDGARVELAIHLAADFADILEANQGQRQQQGDVETHWDAARTELLFRYAHPQLDRAVAIRFERAPAPVRWQDGALLVTLDLPLRRSVELELVVEPILDGTRLSAPPPRFDDQGTSLGRVRQRLRDDAPRLVTSNPTVARAWQTAIADLASLPLGLDSGPATPIAGLPLYLQFFGRDSLTIAWQALLAMPSMLRDTLRANASIQGTTIDDWRDEEPGKMLHQARHGPLSELGKDPFTRYFGDYATAPDFLIMLGQYLTWTNDLATVRALLPVARRAIEWLERYGDLDGDGFVEYVTRSSGGVKNQGWKDANNAIVDEHGQLVPNPIATCELQAYWYVGLQQVALAFFLAGDRGYALELLRKARHLKQRFDRAFWMEDERFYALALGPDKQQVRSISSNPGHLLAAGIVPKQKAKWVAQRLMQPDLFSGWGIRTLSSEHPSFNPFSYHLGSVWPVENGTFALGFGRYGCVEQLHRLAEGIFAATDLFVGNRLPESLGGLPRDADHPHPGIYPQSNEPQGWSASSIVILIQALLGLRPFAPLGLLLVDPQLPDWLPDLRLEGIPVGAGRVDLQVWRTHRGETRYRVARGYGGVRVLRQPPPDAPGAGPGGRLLAAIGSLPGL